MKRKLISVSLALALGLSLAACGSKPAPSGAETPAGELGTLSGPVELQFWHSISNQNHLKVLEGLVEEFNETIGAEKGITVVPTFNGSSSELYSSVVGAIKAGSAPDVTLALRPYVADYLQTDYVVNLEPYITDPNVGMTDHEEFLQIFRQHVTRPGSEKLLDWLDKKTDFFTAPASTRFHGACEGGLCMHSLNVYHALHDSFFTEGESEESYAICALLHDLCKANYYKLGTRNVKNEATGQWEKAPFYSVEDLFPYGHGEKSVFLIERFMKLKVEEAVAIRWHMGGFDDAARGGCFAISEAYDKYPLAVKLHIADLQATYLMEHRTSNMR